ncbi:MAG: hypothetical protein QME75_06030 [Deltaproteobacteria bacterium]|nr:hypothetical protein [Deltaproteobacteria bacterium]
MRQASPQFIQEEARLRGGRPRVKAIIYPFDLDYGLGPGLGVFENTVFGGEPGKIALAAGYLEYAAWTSPVRQAFSPFLTGVAVYWENHIPYMKCQVYLRSAANEAELGAAPFQQLAQGKDADLGAFYQVKVEFTDSTWSGEPSGYISGLRLEGRLTIPESEIIDAGEVRVSLARNFSEHRVGDHTLVLDNRDGQWLPKSTNFPFLGLPCEQKRLDLFHGWELPDGTTDWLLLYRGVVERLEGMAHGWREKHRVSLQSRDRIAHCLQKRIGAPGAGGDRQPFMRGMYLARGELVHTTPAQVGAPVKTGSGSAALQVLGTYTGQRDQTYLLEVETSGEVGEAAFRWSTNLGQSWRETGIATAGAEDPVELSEGLAVFWESGIGVDFEAGDCFRFQATAPVYHYKVFGGPFTRIASVLLNGEETWEGVAADAATGEILVTGQSAMVEARVVKDATTHPVDIISDILAEVGLEEVMNADSFSLAKSLTPDYAVGACFENITAAQAIREVVRRTLYDLWVDFGEIKIRAYLGED